MIIVVVVTEEIPSEIKNRGKKLIYVVMDVFFYSLTQVYSEKKILVVRIVIAFMLITTAFKTHVSTPRHLLNDANTKVDGVRST